MNATAESIATLEIPTIPGTPFGGGFYVGRFACNGEQFALIVAPKSPGEHDDIRWHSNYDSIEGALSYNNGQANTQAMAEAGSDLAKWALALEIDRLTDWYLPSLDELELCYRALKPTEEENAQWARSGINLSAVPPTWPYTADMPAQTSIEPFRADGSEAFEAEPYWSSTQYAGLSYDAWAQTFTNGGQYFWCKLNFSFRARAVRKIKI